MRRICQVFIATVLMAAAVFAGAARADDVPPRITSFAAIPNSVRPGQPVTLSWTTEGADSVTIDTNVGAVPLSGCVEVVPPVQVVYTLTARKGTASATATVLVLVMTAPSVVVHAIPRPILQPEGTGGGTTTYVVSNNGGLPASVTLFAAGNFFSESPSFFTLPGGKSQVVTVTANALPRGAYDGAVRFDVTGVPSIEPLQIPIRVLSVPPPAGVASASPSVNRIDLATSSLATHSGSVTFTNGGDAALYGALAADVPWIAPQNGLLKIDAGATATFTFDVDQTKITQTDFGSATGTLSLLYLGGTAGNPVPAASSVTVVNTLRPPVADAPPPPLLLDEVAMFVPGVGHVAGTVGTFISDIAMFARPGTAADATLYYSSVDGSVHKSTNVMLGQGSIELGDIVKSVFGADAQVGSLMVRSKTAANVLMSATVFNVSNPAGTYGTTIPIFRSDRAAAAGEKIVLTGLRRDATSHTNLFLQEMSGTSGTVRTEFLAADGSSLGVRNDSIASFALLQINNVVPEKAVAAELTNTSPGLSRFMAYATPVDDASGDNWSIADWSRQFGGTGTEAVVIPVAGVLSGANNTFFRTDLAITNASATSGTATLRFVPRSGAPTEKTITLGARQTTILDNVVGKLFAAPDGTVGFILLTPVTGSFAATSRTYTTVAGQAATFGTGVPLFPVKLAIKAGGLQAVGNIHDSSIPTIIAGRPATFRTNFGFLETSGNAVRLRVTLKFRYAAGMRLQTTGTASKDYALAPNQFVMLNGIANEILGADAFAAMGDLHGFEAYFQVIDGSGAVVVFTSSVDNGSGDSILRME